jgi:hypothetical protein
MRARRIIGVAVAIGLLAVTVALLAPTPGHGTASQPQFVKMEKEPVGTFSWQQYDWAAAVPFQGGKMWVMTTLGTTNHPYLLYDLEKKRVEGELLNGGAIFFNGDLTKVFCEGPLTAVITWKTRLFERVNRFVPGKFGIPTNRVEAFWILDLRDNSAKRVGNLSQMPGTGSRWYPSPGFRYGYTRPTTLEWGKEFILCELEGATMEKVSLNADLLGWWDDQNILVKDADRNFVLWDVASQRTTPLFTQQQVEAVLKENGLDDYRAPPSAFTSWNGKDYDVYFFCGPAGSYKPDSGRSFLLKADRATKTLRVHSREFRFGYLGTLNETGTLYAYNGESGPSGRGGSGAVHVRDLRDESERAVVAADNRGQYALPRFYGDTIVFWRNRLLWRQKVDETNAVRLLPDGK